ncbi:hypothetical protein DRN75_04255 [Nanoarchaeota archaeon]|nr:MAG: hypothetical protein DRN75_04255 [Nanoarchaeota archaeon]
MGRHRSFKGFSLAPREEVFMKLKEEPWHEILEIIYDTKPYVLIPFMDDYVPVGMEELEDNEWEYMGVVHTLWYPGTVSRIAIFRRRV